MADLTAEATAPNAKQELQKILKEIFEDGEGDTDFGETDAVKSTDDDDEAIKTRQWTCLRNAESEKPESDISPVEVPKEFKCPLSNDIMIEPVTIASGQTYEKRDITEWLKNHNTCPKTEETLPNSFWTPNHVISELITQWCRVNNYDRPKPSGDIVTELLIDDIESLLQRISSPSSLADQTEAVKELSHQTNKFANVRVFFVAKIPDSISRLLTPLSVLRDEVDWNPEFLENIVTSLYNMSTFEKNKTVIAENPHVIPLLTKSLKQGTALTRRNAAATLSSLSDIDSNKIIIIGNSEALKALIDLIEEGDLLVTSEAIGAVYNLCYDNIENMKKAVSAGLGLAVTKKIIAGGGLILDELLSLLAYISPHKRVIEEVENQGVIFHLFSVLRKQSSLVTCEKALTIVFSMYRKNRERSRMEVLAEEEKQHETFTKLASQVLGLSDHAVRKANGILQWIKIFSARK